MARGSVWHFVIYFMMVVSNKQCFVRSSKALLLAYIKSEKVVAIMGADKSDELVTYLRNKVFPNEQFLPGTTTYTPVVLTRIPTQYSKEPIMV